MKEKTRRNRKVQSEKKNECGVVMKQVQDQACCVPVTYCDSLGCYDEMYCC